MNDIQTAETSLLPNTDQEINLQEVGRFLWAQRKAIFLVTALITATSLLLALTLPKRYSAVATILPMASSDVGNAMVAGLANQMGGAAGLLGGLGLGIGKSADLFEILESRSMAERVIIKCQLENQLKGWKTHGDLVGQVQNMTTIVPASLKTKIIEIRVQAPTAQLAADIANAYVFELKDMLDEIGYNNASRNRKFIEIQLAKTTEDLAKSENKLAEFQANNRLASLPETVMATIKSISELEAQRIGTEVQRKSTDETLGEIRSKVSALQADPSMLVELELKTKGLAAQETALTKAKEAYLDQLITLPPKAMALARLQRDVQVQNAIYLALRQQYETAIISENKESDSFLPLDKADAPDRHNFPNKRNMLLAGFVGGCMLGVLGVLTRRAISIKQPNQS